jgi:hypothetical protein
LLLAFLHYSLKTNRLIYLNIKLCNHCRITLFNHRSTKLSQHKRKQTSWIHYDLLIPNIYRVNVHCFTLFNETAMVSIKVKHLTFRPFK